VTASLTTFSGEKTEDDDDFGLPVSKLTLPDFIKKYQSKLTKTALLSKLKKMKEDKAKTQATSQPAQTNIFASQSNQQPMSTLPSH
jgi:hypothetical protein